MTALSPSAASRKGQDWQRRCAAYARQWYPAAEHVGRFPPPHAGDLLAVGDRIIECTVSPLSELARKLDQAEGDAALSELSQFFVWKTAPGKTIGLSYMITRAGVLWPLLARLDRLEQWEAEATGHLEDEFTRGYEAGLRARDGANR